MNARNYDEYATLNKSDGNRLNFSKLSCSRKLIIYQTWLYVINNLKNFTGISVSSVTAATCGSPVDVVSMHLVMSVNIVL